MLYACLTGQPPYPRATELATLWAHLQESPPRPSVVDPALAGFDPVIARGMAVDPAERFPSAAELLSAARAALVSEESAAPARPGHAAPAPRAAPAGRPGSGPPNNLPLELSSFVGRDVEVREVRRLLGDGRLVTVTGPGGTGKTRLAVRAATEALPDYRDGVFFTELSSITDPDLVPPQIASVLGLPETAGESVEDALVGDLASKQLLLVLDNLEQVISVAPFVGRLVARCPALHVLATSRLPLHLATETEYPLSPLAVPEARGPLTAAGATESDAVALFVARATAVRNDFRITDDNAAAITSICRKVDGLPLALELAAARVKVLGPSQILSRLDDRLGLLTDGPRDRPERHQTLRATIAWSHDLLPEPERVVFRRLAVFDGGLTFATAEAVCRDAPARANILEKSVTSLVEAELLRPAESDGDEPRFAMLETIREFAAERLAEAGESEAIRRRHFETFLEIGRQFEAELGGGTWRAGCDGSISSARISLPRWTGPWRRMSRSSRRSSSSPCATTPGPVGAPPSRARSWPGSSTDRT